MSLNLRIRFSGFALVAKFLQVYIIMTRLFADIVDFNLLYGMETKYRNNMIPLRNLMLLYVQIFDLIHLSDAVQG